MKFGEIKKINWIKSWVGKWSLLTCAYLESERTKKLAKYSIVSKNGLIIVIGGFSAGYLDNQEVKKVADKIISLIDSDKNFASDRCLEIIKLTDFFNEYCGKNDAETLFNLKEYLKFFDNFSRFAALSYFLKNFIDYAPEKIKKRLLPELLAVRKYSENVYYITERFLEKFSVALEKKFKIKKELILCLTKNEMEQLLSGKKVVTKKELALRNKGAAMVCLGGKKENLFSGKDFEKIKNSLNKKLVKKIKGKSAYPGKVRGTARIVLNVIRPGVFNFGDILVAGMTRPDYLPLLKKAAAFVTDAGGILSHAAIYAREFKKPCVIGTQISTKVLHDGDLVEVDANKGIVKIINKK